MPFISCNLVYVVKFSLPRSSKCGSYESHIVSTSILCKDIYSIFENLKPFAGVAVFVTRFLRFQKEIL
ncbi:hypothetical protein [Campylobacter concisus]